MLLGFNLGRNELRRLQDRKPAANPHRDTAYCAEASPRSLSVLWESCSWRLVSYFKWAQAETQVSPISQVTAGLHPSFGRRGLSAELNLVLYFSGRASLSDLLVPAPSEVITGA